MIPRIGTDSIAFLQSPSGNLYKFVNYVIIITRRSFRKVSKTAHINYKMGGVNEKYLDSRKHE